MEKIEEKEGNSGTRRTSRAELFARSGQEAGSKNADLGGPTRNRHGTCPLGNNNLNAARAESAQPAFFSRRHRPRVVHIGHQTMHVEKRTQREEEYEHRRIQPAEVMISHLNRFTTIKRQSLSLAFNFKGPSDCRRRAANARRGAHADPSGCAVLTCGPVANVR